MKPISAMLFAIITVGFCSCQKVINVKVNSSSSQYVIEGNITDQPGPYIISISKSIDVDQDNFFPAVNNAFVYVTDITANVTDTLKQVSAGRYQTQSLAGIPGHIYTLLIMSNGKTFTSTSAMPQPIGLDSLYTVQSLFGRNTNIVPVYKDPAGTGNYYHEVLTIRDSVSTEIYIHDDEITDGNEVMVTLRNEIKVNPGDPITVELQCIDHPVFTYFRDLEQTAQANSATPANPESNITGGALGYFSAHTVRKKTILAP